MRGLAVRAIAASFCVLAGLTGQAQAQTSTNTWVSDAEALARYIETNNLLLTDSVREARAQAVDRMRGVEKLQGLYDLAVKAAIDGDTQRGPGMLDTLVQEARAQGNTRYLGMAEMIRAFAPARAGDIVAARRNLELQLDGVTDAYVRASGERLHAYVLTDLGLYGNALEAARAGILHLPADATTWSLRSGLHNALSYNASRIGDNRAALEHLQRNVELAVQSGNPIDGLMVLNNAAIMLGQAGEAAAARRLVTMHSRLADKSGLPRMRFLSDQLCARIALLTDDAAGALQCAEAAMGRINAGVQTSPEYVKRVHLYRLQALARLGRGAEARAALDGLRAMAAQRGDPGLTERLDLIEPEVLNAEGRYAEAFQAMRRAHDTAERNVMTRFNDGVRDMRATMESEVAHAEERAAAQQVRSELQSRTLEKMTLGVLLAGACLLGMIAVAFLIYRSRRNMLVAVGRAEAVLARRGGAVTVQADTVSPTRRLTAILDEIERRDVELERAFVQLEAAREAAESANVVKSQFLTTMSHELRTPLNAIIGYAELLMEVAEENGADMEHKDLNRILGAATRLLVLVNDVLDLSKIEAGRMTASAVTVDVRACLNEIVETVAPAAKSHGDKVVADFADNLGVAYTDGFKLSQCVLNLMSNAVKFTKNGDVTLRAKRELAGGVDWLCFEVADNGIGISAEAQARLFQPFVQADASITRAHGGTGLGLAITRKLAQLLGGDVSVTSELGAGATFSLRVPANLPGLAAANDACAARAAA